VRVLLFAVGLLAVASASIAFSLRVTPVASVTVLGQTVAVGTATPTLSLAGPGELDLFGQALPTKIRFDGPLRPRLVLQNITVNEQVASLLHAATRSHSLSALGAALAAAWERYFVREMAFAAVGALVLLGLITGWRRGSRRQTVALVIGGVLVVELANAALIGLTARTAPEILRRVGSLDQLVGSTAESRISPAPGPPLRGVQAIVLGDSTAAGLGGRPLQHPTAADAACQRSADAYAVDLARANAWNVVNLSCSGASIAHGLLGPQTTDGTRLPAQVAVAARVRHASLVIVSVGANDLGWSQMVELCAVSSCNDRASEAYFQRTLQRFTQNYYDLLRQLAELHGTPRVIVNLYYTPFTPGSTCLSRIGLTPDRIRVLLERLGAINSVLREGADTFGDLAVQPEFIGHELCRPQPYVQGLADPAPFHPTAAGSLAIALADERALTADQVSSSTTGPQASGLSPSPTGP
jgi:lysophospholipase L1-like esterase